MKSLYFAAYSPASAILWTADVAVGNTAADRRRAAAARAAAPESDLFFQKRNSEVLDFRAKLLTNSPEIPHFDLSVAKFLAILKGTANVADVENLSPRMLVQGLNTEVETHRLAPVERDRIVQNFNHCKFIRYGKI